MVLLSSLYNAGSGQLFALAAAFSAALAQGQGSDQLARLGAFFTIVGDTLALYSLDPGLASSAASQSETATSVLSPGETL